MGGTSLDVGLIRSGQIPTTTESWVGDERVATKMVEAQTIGAGGGSLAWINSLGLLRVGPQSASSDPGPACYGRGGDNPTVTDADVLLGYIPTDHFLGGQIRLDAERARQAMQKVAKPLQMTETQAAQAIFKVVNSLMADQVIEQSTKRGYDVRDFAMVVGGGPVPFTPPHIAELLGIPTVLIPEICGRSIALSAVLPWISGTNTRKATWCAPTSWILQRLESLFGRLTEKALDRFCRIGGSKHPN